jgi:hypothetical protein
MEDEPVTHSVPNAPIASPPNDVVDDIEPVSIGSASVWEAADGFRFRITAANGEIIATGEAYTRASNAKAAARALVPPDTPGNVWQ